MSHAIYSLRKLQYGAETANGTLVAADTLLIGEGTVALQRPLEQTEYPRGYRAAVVGDDQIVRQGTGITFRTKLDYEQIVALLNSSGLGAVTPGESEGVYTWDFDPDLTAFPAPKANSYEMLLTDGSSAHFQRAAAFGVTRRLALTFGMGALVDAEAEIFLRADQTLAEVASAAALARKEVPTDLFGFYVNDAWADLGNTQKSGTIRGGTLEIITGVEPDYTADGRADLDFTQLMAGRAEVNLGLTLEFNGNAATELAAWRSRTPRFVQLKATPGAGRSHTINIAGEYVEEPTIGERDGEVETLTMNLHGRVDPTSGKMFQWLVENAIAAV